jgi:hypothetical protein
MAANRVETEPLVFGDRISGDRDRRLHFHLRRRLRDCGMPNMANLAMLFVGGVPMPMPCCLHGKAAHGKNQGHRQQS